MTQHAKRKPTHGAQPASRSTDAPSRALASGVRPHNLLPLAARAIVESAPDAIVLVDQEGSILLVNDQTERLFGYARTQLLGREVELLLPERLREMHRTYRRQFNAEPSRRMMQSRSTELVAARADSTEFPCEIALSPVRTTGGVITIAAVRDITARKQAEHEHASLIRAEEALRMRDEFLSIAAHELRTPLTALQLQLDSLSHLFTRPETQRETALGKLARAVRHLGRLNELVDQLLDVSRITNARLTLRPEKVDMALLVRELVEDFQEQARRAGSTITVAGDTNVEGTWDPFRIEQILANLVSNAIKYGAGNPIEVEVVADRDQVLVRVRDRGIGIRPEDFGRIFNRFERGAPPAHYGGLGLGLYIAKHLTESHGGRIQVESQLGEGTTFELELPRMWPTAGAT